MGQSGRGGHRSLPHTADVIVEASGPDLASCCEEAVAALVETYADPGNAEVVAERGIQVAPTTPDEMLLEPLDEVIFTLDVAGGVPVGARVQAMGDGGLAVRLVLARASSVEAIGAVPKAISRSGLEVARDRAGVRCRFLVDV